MTLSVEELCVLGTTALQRGDSMEALQYYTEVLRLNDKMPTVWANRGIALKQLGSPLDAKLNFDRAIYYEPDIWRHYSNRGTVLFDLEQFDEAVKDYNKASKLNPKSAIPYVNKGDVYRQYRDYQMALSFYQEAVKLDPENPDMQFPLSVCELTLGDYEKGFERFEWRWKTNQLTPRGLKWPVWNGEDLTGKMLLVYQEQGLGDGIQFARFLRVVASKYQRCKIIVECRQPIKRLLETIPDVYAVVTVGDKLPDVDYQIPMMSLPRVLKTTVKTIPSSKREFFLKRDDVDRWKNNFKDLKGIKIGICWAGMNRVANPIAASIDRIRSTNLMTFDKLTRHAGITWISLQKGSPSEEARSTETRPRNMLIADFTEDMHDFYETCCAMENCDLVISVDTAVVHAAASIGRPTWLLSRWDGCWRWLGQRKDSPWYPTLTQFVQDKPRDWGGAIQQMDVALENWLPEQIKNLTLAN